METFIGKEWENHWVFCANLVCINFQLPHWFQRVKISYTITGGCWSPLHLHISYFLLCALTVILQNPSQLWVSYQFLLPSHELLEVLVLSHSFSVPSQGSPAVSASQPWLWICLAWISESSKHLNISWWDQLIQWVIPGTEVKGAQLADLPCKLACTKE
jgi:hypothetical protein